MAAADPSGAGFAQRAAGIAGRNSDPGDRLIYHRLPWEEPDAPTDFAILFEDNNVLVLSKPSGLPVLPGGFFLENTLLHLVRKRYGSTSSPLHRLGRGTSGAILFSRNAPAARSLARAMFERRILKVYLAARRLETRINPPRPPTRA